MDDAKKFFEDLNIRAADTSIAPEQISIPAETPDAMLARANTSVSRKTAREEISLDEEGQLTIDVYQTPEEIVVESPIAGVDPDQVDIEITADTVTIRGKREREQKVRTENYIYQECFWGRFARSVALPEEIDADRAQATIKNSVLTITLPKLKRSEKKKLKVSKE